MISFSIGALLSLFNQMRLFQFSKALWRRMFIAISSQLSSVIIVVVIVVELSIAIFACFIQCCHHTLKFRVLPGDIISVAEQVFNPIMAVESTDEVKIGIFLLEFERLF